MLSVTSTDVIFSLGVSLGAWVAGGISGGHINPAVRILSALLGEEGIEGG